jgi:ABC-2 type transport system permease protein
VRVLLVLIGKVLREHRWTVLFCYAVLLVFSAVGTWLFGTFGDFSMEAMSRMSPELLSGMFGGLFGDMTPLDTWLLTQFAHPLVFTLFSVLVVAIPARSLAGEIDRGTVDLLLSCPVARWQPVVACWLVAVAALAVQAAVFWGGIRLGLALGDFGMPTKMVELRWTAFHLFMLFFGAAGVSLSIAASTSEQGKAIGRSLGFLVVSFLINLLASLWRRIEAIDVLSIFHYFRPQPIVENGGPLLFDLVVLTALGIGGLIVALVVFRRRDVATV